MGIDKMAHQVKAPTVKLENLNSRSEIQLQKRIESPPGCPLTTCAHDMTRIYTQNTAVTKLVDENFLTTLA